MFFKVAVLAGASVVFVIARPSRKAAERISAALVGSTPKGRFNRLAPFMEPDAGLPVTETFLAALGGISGLTALQLQAVPILLHVLLSFVTGTVRLSDLMLSYLYGLAQVALTLMSYVELMFSPQTSVALRAVRAHWKLTLFALEICQENKSPLAIESEGAFL